MFYEIIRAMVQKIFQDKILFGLVIVGFLAIFVGGFGGGSHERVASGPRDARKQVSSESKEDSQTSSDKSPKAQEPQANPAAQKIEPTLATQFVSWWIGNSMDFNPQTAAKNRQEAMKWITPETAPSYQAAFWPPDIADGVGTGRIRGSFTPSAVRAIASNPDGSVVVNVTGSMVLQQGPRPAITQLSTDYLVKRESAGLRIAGLYNRSVLVPNSSTY